ncbi:MAG: hypothetical protein ACRYG8_06105 [Janthinobacterium lividum]
MLLKMTLYCLNAHPFKRKMSLMAMRTVTVAVAVLAGALGSSASADESDSARLQLDKVLIVLRLQSSAASKACLDAMSQVHDTEKQVSVHNNDTGSHPELDIARDVLESDYQNSVQLCGADAARVCREDVRSDTNKACMALQPEGAPSR